MKNYLKSVRFEQELANEINNIADKEYRDFSQVVRMLCKEAIENRKLLQNRCTDLEQDELTSHQ